MVIRFGQVDSGLYGPGIAYHLRALNVINLKLISNAVAKALVGM
jgi:hypothetical protein